MKGITLHVVIAILSALVEGAVGWGIQEWIANDKLQEIARRPSEQLTPDIARKPEEKPRGTETPPDLNWDGQEVQGFGIFVLSQEYRWRLGTTRVVAPGGEDVDMEEKLRGLLFQYSMKYGDLIAVGTASCEGIRYREDGRASDRSEELIAWLRPVLAEFEKDGHRQLYRLNMGQYRDCRGLNTEQTGEQRRVILIALKGRKHMDKAPLEQTLCETLKQRKPLGFDPDEYSECRLLEAR